MSEFGGIRYEGLPTEGLIYLATPYSKYPGGTIKAYVAAAELAGRLMKAGLIVLSPIVHGHPISVHGDLDPLDHEIWLKLDRQIMQRCDAMLIAMMEGWRESYGIAKEIEYMTAWKKPIYELDPDSLEWFPRFGDTMPEHLF